MPRRSHKRDRVERRVVAAEAVGRPVTEIVAELFGLPAERAQVLVDAGAVFADKKRLAADRVLRAGQTLRVDVGFIPPRMPELRSRVLFVDGDLIVLDKPAGMPTVPTWTAAAGSLHHAVREQSLCNWEPMEVHRLDAPTSGVIVFARRGKAQAKLAEAFKCGQVEKVYWARVHGDPWSDREAGPITIDAAMRKNPRNSRRWEIAPKGCRPRDVKRAHTEVAARDRHAIGGRVVSDLEVHPKTGRTHQIRVHLRSLGTPVVGDFHYGDAEADRAVGAGRLWLHAAQITVRHPRTGERVTFHAPAPDTMPGFT